MDIVHTDFQLCLWGEGSVIPIGDFNELGFISIELEFVD